MGHNWPVRKEVLTMPDGRIIIYYWFEPEDEDDEDNS